MTEIMPVPRKLRITVLPAGSLPASSFLSLDGAGGQALDDVLLQEDIDDHHRHKN